MAQELAVWHLNHTGSAVVQSEFSSLTGIGRQVGINQNPDPVSRLWGFAATVIRTFTHQLLQRGEHLALALLRLFPAGLALGQ